MLDGLGDLFLDEVFFFGSSLFRTNFFWSLVFGSYWLIVTWCIVLLLHPLPSVLLGLFVRLPFSFSTSWLCHESWGVLVYSRRYPKYSRLTLPWILSALLLHLQRAGIFPKKHVMDNEVSENMKNHIKDNCRLTVELIPPGCHQQNALP